MVSRVLEPDRRAGKPPRRVGPVTVGLPALLLLVGLAKVHSLALENHSVEDQDQRDWVRARLEPFRGGLSREMFGAIHLTQGIAGVVSVEGGISPEKFHTLGTQLLAGNRIIHNLALAPGNVVSQVVPVAGNERVVGMDYRSIPEQWSGVDRMIRESRIVVAGPVNLIQGGIGIIARLPIHVTDPESGGRRYWGLVSTVIDFPALLADCGADDLGKDLKIALRGVDGTGGQGEPFWGEASLFRPGGAVVVDVTLPRGSWQLAAAPARGWLRFNVWMSSYFQLGTLVVAVMAGILFYLLFVGRARGIEVKRRRGTEAALLRSNRALRLFSEVKGALVRATDEADLFNEICRISVEVAGYRMAWVGKAEHDAGKSVRPIAFAGPGEGFLDKIHVSWGDGPEGQGTAGQAIRTRAPAVARNIPTNENFAPWRTLLRERDFATAISIPIITQGEVFGVLIIYAREPDAFDDMEIGLLEDLASTIGFGLDAIAAQRDRALMVRNLEQARVELENRVVERTRELLVAKEAAESADRLKSTFLASMSHELRTPLNSIIGFTGILLQGLAGDLNEEQSTQLGMVRKSAHHLLALINDVLDISKIEAGQLVLSCEPFDIRGCVQGSLSVLMPLARKKNLALRADVDGSVGSLRGDSRRVGQILINLVGNAIKFTERGEVVVTVERTPGGLEFGVRDTGIGIAPADLAKLFQPFHQVEVGLSRRHEGTGLGLSICRRLLGLMGGTIRVESTPGVGSHFIFTLPTGAEEA